MNINMQGNNNFPFYFKVFKMVMGLYINTALVTEGRLPGLVDTIKNLIHIVKRIAEIVLTILG